MTVKPARVAITAVVETPGDTASDVRNRPKTAHGWRPISVKIQPAVFARYGRADAHTNAGRR